MRRGSTVRAFFTALVLCAPCGAFVEKLEVSPANPKEGDPILVKVSGYFPTPCWLLQGQSVKADAWEILVEVLTLKLPGTCPEIKEPYSFKIELAGFKAGGYRLTVADPQDARALEIAVAPSGGYPTADMNGDGQTDVSDAVFLLLHLFGGGPAPACEGQADANGDQAIDLSDAIRVLEYLFLGGEPPVGRGACGSPADCTHLPWPIFCRGHWECDCGTCRATCDDTSCGDGTCEEDRGETPDSCPLDCKPPECLPVCKFIGTRSEGWYDSCTGKWYKYAICDKCKPECRACGSKSEGWYDSCSNEVILWTDCDCR